MRFTPLVLDGVYTVDLEPFRDGRGWFARTYSKDDFRQIGHTGEWMQLNHSYTRTKGTVRGMHYQVPPVSEIKLVRCIAGSVLDVVIDLRKDSPTFLKWVSVELSQSNQTMIYIPAGFAHGFQSLSDDVELLYHHSENYSPAAERGLRFDDPMINISWPLPVTLISERDQTHPFLKSDFQGI